MGTRLWAVLPIAIVCVSGGCGYEGGGDVRVAADGPNRDGAITVNGSVIIDRETVAAAGDFRTVNGDIHVGEGAHIAACTSVHGRIVVEAAARTGPIESVNGSLSVSRQVAVDGGINLVNGNVDIHADSEVAGNVATVNGDIAIEGAAVLGDVVNYNGAVTVTEGARIMGNVIIRDTVGAHRGKVPRVIIGPDTVIAGRLILERPVHLYVHESARLSLDGAAADPAGTAGALTAAGVAR